MAELPVVAAQPFEARRARWRSATLLAMAIASVSIGACSEAVRPRCSDANDVACLGETRDSGESEGGVAPGPLDGAAASCEPVDFTLLDCQGTAESVGSGMKIQSRDALLEVVRELCPSLEGTQAFESVDFERQQVVALKTRYLTCEGSLGVSAVASCPDCLRIEFFHARASPTDDCSVECLHLPNLKRLVVVPKVEAICSSESGPCKDP